MLELGGSAPRFGGRVAVALGLTDDDDVSESELDVVELLTLLETDDDEATLLELLVALADADELVAELDDVDWALTGPVPVETM